MLLGDPLLGLDPSNQVLSVNWLQGGVVWCSVEFASAMVALACWVESPALFASVLTAFFLVGFYLLGDFKRF